MMDDGWDWHAADDNNRLKMLRILTWYYQQYITDYEILQMTIQFDNKIVHLYNKSNSIWNLLQKNKIDRAKYIVL